MGPINDEHGLEQGGVSSSDFYKIFSKEQLLSAQQARLGVALGPLVVSGIGQADDTALLSNSIHSLNFLLHLTESFCTKYKVQLSSDKTKLLAFHMKHMQAAIEYWDYVNPIKVNNTNIAFSETAEHVGVVRSVAGNLPSLLARITAHKKALGAVLFSGLARNHSSNPAASLRIHQLYANPVLFNGIGSLVLTDQETYVISQHHKETILRLQRLYPLTPRPVIYFLAGRLPCEALVHLRQLSIFGMVSRLPSTILHQHALNIYGYVTKSRGSWFEQIKTLCVKYHLPHPTTLIRTQPSKAVFKATVKKHIVDYWEQQLRYEASLLPSLMFFKPNFMSLTRAHPLWTTAGSSPTKIVMATVQAKFLSGRYRTQALCSHWSGVTATCKLSLTCNTAEDIPHILKHCVALEQTRTRLTVFTRSYCTSRPVISCLVERYCEVNCSLYVQFLLDCSVLPDVIAAVQVHGQGILTDLFNITRMWVYCLHRDRLKCLGRWRNFAK